MEPRKLTSADIDRVRDIEGFPIATDEAIIELSDAPYYTACPNPFIEDFIAENGTTYDERSDNYHCEPFAYDVSEGKGDIIYGAHNYHTKVPYKAIMRYILHYTNPGDVVFDGFCGTGMTGVAAQMCGADLGELRLILQKEVPGARFGARKVILNDLSTIATFIAYNQNTPADSLQFENEAQAILDAFETEYGWMYETLHHSEDLQLSLVEGRKGWINYTVWSDVFICPSCSEEYVFSDVAYDTKTKRVSDKFNCPHCGSSLTKRDCQNAMEDVYDEHLSRSIHISKQVPVLINYTFGGKRYEKRPDDGDYAVIERVNRLNNPYWIPTDRMPEGGESRRNDKYGITHVHHFYTKRSQIAIGCLMSLVERSSQPQKMRFLFEQIILGMAKISRYVPAHFSQVNQYLSGTLYIGSQVVEVSPEYILAGKTKKLVKMYQELNASKANVCITTGSLVHTEIPSNSVDYIFTDPPFGSNLNYSELNYLWEAWMQCTTNSATEAIVNEAVGKQLADYQSMMCECFGECYRVLKPGRWMTVEFHNSKNSVWNAIQEALQRAGFVIADVRTLDKKQGTFKQINSTSAVKQDLVITVYKPRDSFVHEFELKAGTEDAAWEFVRQHLNNVPVVVDSDGDGRIDVIAERQAFLLFDRMVSYHIMNGLAVPLSSAEFYRGLDERFLKRDDMYFLPDQVTEYDTARMKMDVESVQFALLVTNEKTAIGWLYQLLANEPMTYQQIQPKFMQEVKTVDRYEAMPELAVLLEENFLQDERGRWYVPDTKKEGDIAKLREKSLLREFDGYLKSKGKLKLFRSEAIRVGFSHLWKDKNYQAIVDLANRLPAATIQEDPNLLMYYDISLSRVG